MKIDYNMRPYRPCVGIVLINENGKFFLGKRIDYKSQSWQMPQGGIDSGETSIKACFRELKEEVGTDKAEIIHEMKDWLHYDIPKNLADKLWNSKFKGQKQKWFFLKFLGTDKDININSHSHPEFREWKWEEPKLIIYDVIGFKKIVYEKVISEYFRLVH